MSNSDTEKHKQRILRRAPETMVPKIQVLKEYFKMA